MAYRITEPEEVISTWCEVGRHWVPQVCPRPHFACDDCASTAARIARIRRRGLEDKGRSSN